MRQIYFLILLSFLIIPIVSANCVDTDVNNFYQAGTTIFNDINYSDYCISNIILKEYDCDGNYLIEKDIECDYGCFQGACQEINNDSNINCDLLNKDEFITDVFNVLDVELKDTCISYNMMKDYFCDENSLTYRQVECEFDCDIENGRCFKENNYVGCDGFTKTDSCGSYENDCANCGYICPDGYSCKLVTNECGTGAYGVCEISLDDEEKTAININDFRLDGLKGDHLVFNIEIYNNNSTTKRYTLNTFDLFNFSEYIIEPSSRVLSIENGSFNQFVLTVIPNENAIFGRNNFQITINSNGDDIFTKNMWVYIKENIDDPDELLVMVENCNGCVDRYMCFPIGYRDSDIYCESKNSFVSLKDDLDICNNDYECKSNNCKDNKCIPNCYGCDFGGANFCVPIGTRIGELYCSPELTNEIQKDNFEVCENNYECSSNICIDNQCIEKGFFTKIINWFKDLFN